MTTRLIAGRLAPAPAGPRADRWDAAEVPTRLQRAKILVASMLRDRAGVLARVLHETIECSMLTDDKSINDAEREDLRRLVVALKMVDVATGRLEKRWGWK